MAIEVKHKFQSPGADSADTSIVRPSNWNDTHKITLNGFSLIGKATASNGDAQEITLGAGLSFVGGQLSAGTIAGRALTVSSAAPSGGENGDIHFQV